MLSIYQVLAEHQKKRDGSYLIPITVTTKSGKTHSGSIQDWKEATKIVQIVGDSGTVYIEIESIESVAILPPYHGRI